MKLRWPRRQPQQPEKDPGPIDTQRIDRPPRELTLSEKILLERQTERMLERLRLRVTSHKCPRCDIWHGGPGA